MTCLHKWFALGMLRYSIESIRAFFSKIRFMDILKKFLGIFYYCFLSIANGAIESEFEDDDVESNSGIERIIVVALTTFLFFVLVLYGASSAAGFVESLNPTGPE